VGITDAAFFVQKISKASQKNKGEGATPARQVSRNEISNKVAKRKENRRIENL
jgi:hypothetical protein